MPYNQSSKVEAYFSSLHTDYDASSIYRKIPVIVVDNYVELGQLTALRFLEWVSLNRGGLIALPTGKTPEFFIRWVQFYLENWRREMNNGLLAKIGLAKNLFPDMASLHFYQMDEFFPIQPEHERSFGYFINKFYIRGFGLDPGKVHLIDTFHFPGDTRKHFGRMQNVNEVFPDGVIDLTLRIQKPKTERDLLRQKAIRVFDQFCQNYEDDIQERGGIGFFLGGIGPDGHIAFNVSGSAHHSPTRLTNINYESQAAAAIDLGGIEVVKKKAVITIGLKTITQNKDTVAIIMAAGQSKSGVVKDAVENSPSVSYPATSLQKLGGARFYIARSATSALTLNEENIRHLMNRAILPASYTGKLIHDGTLRNTGLIGKTDKRGIDDAAHRIEEWQIAARISGKPAKDLFEDSVKNIGCKIETGLNIPDNQRIVHTAPHHDDIELAYFPLLHHLVRSPKNQNYFVYCTSGFTAVTNQYVLECLENLRNHILSGKFDIEKDVTALASYENAQDDITGYLNGIASQNTDVRHFNVSCRLCRLFLDHLKTHDIARVGEFTVNLISQLSRIEPGRNEPEIFHLIKGWLREYEAELVWAYFGIDMDHVYHLRLPFYSANIFPDYPNEEQDVKPIVRLFDSIKPTIVTLALDPEGSGPDTHFKALIALADALDAYVIKQKESDLRIWGYRNIWSRYQIHEVNKIVPVSLNSFAVLHNMFNSCFLSQRSASFPSYELDGTFSELAQKIWVEQHNDLVELLGKEHFYESSNPMLRRSYGAIYLKDMSYQEFREYMLPVRELLKSKDYLERA